jgi:CBS domain-containing protein
LLKNEGNAVQYAQYSMHIYHIDKHVMYMGYKNDTVDDSLVEDYMTTATMTMNFKNNVLGIAKKMYAQNISSVPITDDEGEIIGILT